MLRWKQVFEHTFFFLKKCSRWISKLSSSMHVCADTFSWDACYFRHFSHPGFSLYCVCQLIPPLWVGHGATAGEGQEDSAEDQTFQDETSTEGSPLCRCKTIWLPMGTLFYIYLEHSWAISMSRWAFSWSVVLEDPPVEMQILWLCACCLWILDLIFCLLLVWAGASVCIHLNYFYLLRL